MKLESWAKYVANEGKDAENVTLESCDASGSLLCCDTPSQNELTRKIRTAELQDEILFKQPDGNHLGDCPICFLPMPLNDEFCSHMPCCLKRLCHGCSHVNCKQESCFFCRAPWHTLTEKKRRRIIMRRAKANDPTALRSMGLQLRKKGDHKAAFEYFSKAQILGDVDATFDLAYCYYEGLGIEKDEEKLMHLLKVAAIGGHSDARFRLGVEEYKNGNREKAVKNLIISAKQGNDEAIKALKHFYKVGTMGLFTKEDFASALRGHQAALDATKSKQREEALKILEL